HRCCAYTFSRNSRGPGKEVGMVKTEDLSLVEIAGSEISFKGERQLSPAERMAVRTAAFGALSKCAITRELIDLVENFEGRTTVEIYVVRPTQELKLKFGVRLKDQEEQQAISAAEALVFFLRLDLRLLKFHERKRSAAPARKLGLTPRSVIAEIALDLLDSCASSIYPPGFHLIELFRELLNLEGEKLGLTRHVDAQEKAAHIVAQTSTVATRELARLVGVNPSTVLRWRRSAEFKKKVELYARKSARREGYPPFNPASNP